MAFNVFVFVTSLILAMFIIPISALFLKLTTKIFKLQDASYGTAFKVAAILGGVGIIVNLILSFISSILIIIIIYLVFAFFGLWLLKKNYFVSWGKTVGVLLVWTIFSAIIIFILLALVIMIGLGALFSQF
jgi:hypothetical protein